MKKILDIDNEIQALRIKDLLDSKGIPHVIRSFHFIGAVFCKQNWVGFTRPFPGRNSLKNYYFID